VDWIRKKGETESCNGFVQWLRVRVTDLTRRICRYMCRFQVCNLSDRESAFVRRYAVGRLRQLLGIPGLQMLSFGPAKGSSFAVGMLKVALQRLDERRRRDDDSSDHRVDTCLRGMVMFIDTVRLRCVRRDKWLASINGLGDGQIDWFLLAFWDVVDVDDVRRGREDCRKPQTFGALRALTCVVRVTGS